MQKTLKKLNIFTQIDIIDWISFNQIYTPILGAEISNLYISIYYQKQIFNHLGITSYDLDVFINNLNTKNIDEKGSELTFDTFKDQLWLLEELKLVQVSIKHNSDNSVDYGIKILPPYNIKEAMQDIKIKNKLKSCVTKHKFDEISLIAEDNINFGGMDLDLTPENKNIPTNNLQNYQSINNSYISNVADEQSFTKNKTSKNSAQSESVVIDKNLYYEFYNGIFQQTGNVFVVSDNILQMIKSLHLGDEKIPLEKLQYFAMNSLKRKNKKHYICEETFEYLIHSELYSNKSKFNFQEYKSFWVELLNNNDQKNYDEFKRLFSQHSSIDFYAQITKKDYHPAGLEKWTNDCIKNKNFSFDILNAMISFVKIWIKNISINYLIKFANTVYDNDLLDVQDFLLHIKNLIKHDIKNGNNRLNVKNNKVERVEDSFDNKIFI